MFAVASFLAGVQCTMTSIYSPRRGGKKATWIVAGIMTGVKLFQLKTVIPSTVRNSQEQFFRLKEPHGAILHHVLIWVLGLKIERYF